MVGPEIKFPLASVIACPNIQTCVCPPHSSLKWTVEVGHGFYVRVIMSATIGRMPKGQDANFGKIVSGDWDCGSVAGAGGVPGLSRIEANEATAG